MSEMTNEQLDALRDTVTSDLDSYYRELSMPGEMLQAALNDVENVRAVFDELKAARERIAVLETALTHYADERDYQYGDEAGILFDGGQTARDALA